MAINSFPSRKGDSIILQSVHLAVLSGLLGFPLFLYEILDVIDKRTVASFEWVLLIDLVVVSLLSFVDSSSAPAFAKEKVMHSEVFRQRKEICARCLCVGATERDLFEVDNQFISGKVNTLLDKASRMVGRLDFGASEITRLSAYMKFVSGDITGALDLFKKSYPDPSELMKQIGSREMLEHMQKRRFLF